MIKSMTGYGRHDHQYGDIRISCEIKSLNGKVTDVRLKSNVPLGNKEIEVRKLITDVLKRGKIDATLHLEGELPMSNVAFDTALIKSLHTQLQPVFHEMGEDSANILPAILRMPHVLQTQSSEVQKDLWLQIEQTVKQAAAKIDGFRSVEGKSIHADFASSVSSIETHLDQIDPMDEARMQHLRDRLKQKVDDYLKNENVDQNRFEQEVLFYLEKLDINEEKVRLKQHCTHFKDVLGGEKVENGKKLAFISQEMGREINTMGAKAQWTPIQKHVVEMKNELEKIKEQLANTV